MRMTRMRTTTRTTSLVVAVVAFLALGACKTGAPAPDPLVFTGEAIQAVGAKFLETAGLYDALYRQKKVTEAQYDAWRVFTPKFQAAHRTAFTTWQQAVATKDRSGAERAQAIVDSLRLQMLELALGVTVPAPPPR